MYWEDTNLALKDPNTFLFSLKDVIYSNYTEKWKIDIYGYTKLRSFILFKTNFKLENYLVVLKDYKLKKCMSKFRLSSHDLEIDKGRYFGVPLEQRLCKFCNRKCVEDENHFLMECNYYNEIQESFFKVLRTKCMLVDPTFENILSSNDHNVIFHVAKCIYKMFKKRNVII